MRLYNYSCTNLIMSVLPEYPWIPWKFLNVPNGYWNEIENQIKFMRYLGEQLKVKTMEDWYGLTARVLGNMWEKE